LRGFAMAVASGVAAFHFVVGEDLDVRPPPFTLLSDISRKKAEGGEKQGRETEHNG
jgi:hypothetical protein